MSASVSGFTAAVGSREGDGDGEGWGRTSEAGRLGWVTALAMLSVPAHVPSKMLRQTPAM